MTANASSPRRLWTTRAVLFALGAISFITVNAHADSTQVLIAHGLVTKEQGDGADLFFRGQFSGNSRTCGTCHRVDNNLGIDAPFIATLPPDDPIFVAEPGFPGGGVPGLERPALMRAFGLILENVDGLENPTVKFVMRGVPHTLSMGKTVTAPADGRAPVERTGWSGDGAPGNGSLNQFARGAVIQHFTKTLKRVSGVDFREPTATELKAIEEYMRATGRTSELNVANARLTNASAELGRRIFNNNNTDPTIASGKCLACHFNAGSNSAPAGTTNGNFNTGVETVPHQARLQVENFPFDGGFGITVRPCDGDKSQNCFGDGTFNAPSVIEAADTPPFFHNNVTPDIEGAVEFYSSPNFQASPSGLFFASQDPNGIGISLTDAQSGNVADFLRVINASFNADMSIQRNTAALSLENSSFSPCGGGGGGDPTAQTTTASATGDSDALCTDSTAGGDVSGKRATVDRELELSNEEAQDAIDVLTAKNLHSDARTLLQSAISKNNQAIASNQSQTRLNLINGALTDLKAAKAKFGTGLTLTMGQANLLF